MSIRYLLLVGFVAACVSPVQTQEMIEVEFLGSRSLSEARELLGPLAQNGVDLYRVLYSTRDLAGVRDTASGLLIIPDREQEARPLLVYQHGTVSSKTDVPSQLGGGALLAQACGALGYVTLAPDYLGLGASRGFHPYIHAASEAWVAIDMLEAVQTALPSLNVQVNEQLFITGYSQGGHAAMALHRELEQNYAETYKVTAAAPLSGPYSISGEMKKQFLSDEEYFYPVYLVYTVLSYDLVYGLYDRLEEYFDPDFVRIIGLFRDNALGLDTFNAILQSGLRQKYGASIPKYLLQDSIRQAVLTNPEHPFNLAMAANDVYEWAPKAPTRLFYCRADDQVPYTNSLVARDGMQALGAVDVEAIDVKTDADHSECVFPADTAMLIFFARMQDVQTATAAPTPADLRIFPNPARRQLFVQGLSPGQTVELFDWRGRRRGQWIARGETWSIPVAGYGSGLYVLRISGREGSWSRKVLLTPD